MQRPCRQTKRDGTHSYVSYHFARQQTWHDQRRPAAHGHQPPGSPAPGWAWRMQWSAHSTSCCSLGWTWSCLPAGCSTSCALLGPAQAPPLITRGIPHHKGYSSSQGVPLIARNTPHHKGQTHHKGYYSSQGADSSQNATGHPKVPPLITKSTGHKTPPVVTRCFHQRVVYVWLQKLHYLNTQK